MVRRNAVLSMRRQLLIMHCRGVADKKELLLRAKYDALAETGGKGAVRKAIEKKQKKVNQKEKKRRLFAPGPQSGSTDGSSTRLKRPHSGGEGWPRKRSRPS